MRGSSASAGLIGVVLILAVIWMITVVSHGSGHDNGSGGLLETASYEDADLLTAALKDESHFGVRRLLVGPVAKIDLPTQDGGGKTREFWFDENTRKPLDFPADPAYDKLPVFPFAAVDRATLNAKALAVSKLANEGQQLPVLVTAQPDGTPKYVFTGRFGTEYTIIGDGAPRKTAG